MFFVEERLLLQGGQPTLRCIVGDKVTVVLEEVYSGACDEHQGRSGLLKQLIHLGYNWPTMEAGANSFARHSKYVSLIVTESTYQQLNFTAYLLPGHFTQVRLIHILEVTYGF